MIMKPNPFGTRAETLARTLLERIATGDLNAGDRLHYEDVEAQYNVSRTVVREALRILEGKGLIDARPNVGTRITPATDWNLLDPDLLTALAEHDPELRTAARSLRDFVRAYTDARGPSKLTTNVMDTLNNALAA